MYKREVGNFELADRLVAGDRENSVKLLSKILDDGAEPVMLLGMLSYSFRRLLIVKDMMERGATRDETARVLNLRYRDQEAFFAAARRAELAKLKKVIQRLAETDLAIKTSKGGGGPEGSRMQIEMFACEILAAN
ncbi:MAG: hypothetical protein LC734_01500 [Acidobacteria bacterium]|nr:hypothetical protein [Acidobacteriota bacterium]